MKKLSSFLFLFVFSQVVIGQGTVKVGDEVPLFSALADDEQVWDLADYLHKKNVVVYFYPAAMTGGCTKQACSYRDHMVCLEKADAVVVGISGDDVASLQVFRKAKNLNFTLLSDHDGAVARLFGVPVGAGGSITRTVGDMEYVLNRGVTTQRWTFVIGKDGKIRYINQQVDAASDYKAVMEVLSDQ